MPGRGGGNLSGYFYDHVTRVKLASNQHDPAKDWERHGHRNYLNEFENEIMTVKYNNSRMNEDNEWSQGTRETH